MAPFIALRGSDKQLVPGSRPAGPVDPKEAASITVRVRASGSIQNLLQKAYDLGTQPLADRKYLSVDELQEQFGADPKDLDAVEHFAQEHNLMVVHRSASERSVVLSGSLGNLLKAFPADVQMYHHATGTYRGRRGEIMVPAQISDIVTGIFGYDTRPKQRWTKPLRLRAAGDDQADGVPATEFAHRYNFPVRHQGTELDGAGQTIAIIELGGGYRSGDLQAYFQKIGVRLPTVSSILIDHAGNEPTSADSADGEVMLDIEVAGAVAPGANIAVYFAPNNGDHGFLDALSAAIHDAERTPSVISISWGSPENNNDLQAIGAYHELFAAAAVLGITICVASGDHGTADMDALHWDQGIHVDHPACDDLVLACGGTQMDGANAPDVAWNDGTPFNVTTGDGGGWASGGGISTIFNLPAYQENAGVPVSIDTGQAGRGVPDIAMSAVNYFVRVDSYEGVSGGTSAVAPLMAALVARLNQAKRNRLGFLNPFLYSRAEAGIVRDVVSGTNEIRNTLRGYAAGQGWDACTGLGTPDGQAILDAL